jgi:ABC-type sugar transport system ATPase subunit
MDAIQVAGLSKRYGKIEALRGVDLRVPEGAVFGLVGPNGAGKTTLIKALVGALRPSEGASVTCPNPRRCTRICRHAPTSSSSAPPTAYRASKRRPKRCWSSPI